MNNIEIALRGFQTPAIQERLADANITLPGTPPPMKRVGDSGIYSRKRQRRQFTVEACEDHKLLLPLLNDRETPAHLPLKRKYISPPSTSINHSCQS